MVLKVLADVLGNKIKSRQARSDAVFADRLSDQNATVADRRNRKAATVAHKRDRSNMKYQNTFSSKEAAKARDHDAAMMDKSRGFQNEDYARQKADQANQFVDLRAAAEKAGLNPLSVLGTGMTPVGGGTLQGTTSAAAYGATAPASSVPMSYGQPVYVSPLASNDAIIGTVEELGRVFTGPEAIAKANEKATAELTQIEAERKQAGLEKAIVPPSQGQPGQLRPKARPVSSMRVSENVVQAGGVQTGRSQGPGGRLVDTMDEGFAETYSSKPDYVNRAGLETRPSVLATGTNWITNPVLPWSNESPYWMVGEPDDTENFIMNSPLFGLQIAARATGKIRERTDGSIPLFGQPRSADDYVMPDLYAETIQSMAPKPVTQSPRRLYVPSLSMGVPGPYR